MAKRPRGRPKKEKIELPKRPRGRPKKEKIEIEKNPVGRPKKLTKYYQYVENVLKHKILVCDATYKAVLRFANDIEKKNSEFFFDEKEADKIIQFIENLEIFEGKQAGQLLKLDDWQAFIIANIFGWKRRSDGKRRYKKAFICVGRGNGKTPLAAAMSIVSLLKDNGAQIYSLATTYQQASLALNWVKNFVMRNKELSEIVKIYDKSVFFEKKFSVFRALSKSFKSFDGFNPSFVIADEVAAMADYELLNVMETALHKRDESLLVMITTANTVNLNSPGLAEYDYAKKILNGVINDERYFSIIYELDKNDDWKNTKLYAKANPASWLNIQELKEAMHEAENNKLKEKSFRTKNLNTWMLGTNNEWINIEIWNKAIENAKQYSNIDLTNRPCTIGADFSERRDLTVYTLAFYIKELDKIALRHRVFIPVETLKQRESNEHALYWKWIEQGFVNTCEGEYIDRELVCSMIEEDIKKYNARILAFDPFASYEYEERLKDKIKMIAILQDMKTFSPATMDFEEIVRNYKVIDDNPVMQWCMSNAVVYECNKLIKVQKVNKDSARRIDCIISSILAYSQLKIIISDNLIDIKDRNIKNLKSLLYK